MMMSTNENWVRIFDIPETSQHKRGFTIYKVISMLYPSNCPDAITKITVWKRYNDFKKLHREMKRLHKSLCMTDVFPVLPNTSFFRRFDEEVVENRRRSALQFLEYLGQHFQLFTAKEFIKFFESSHVSGDQLDGNINSIKAELNLPSEPEYVSFLSPNSDDEHTSDTDSMSTLSSLSTSFQVVDFFADVNRNRPTKSVETASASSGTTVGDSEVKSPLDGHIYPTPPHTPSSLNDNEVLKYISEASEHANLAVEFERNGNYEEAFTSYKASIDVLLKGVKGDKDINRRTSIRYKIEKYLLRAEKIYNMHLSPEMRSFRELTQVERESIVHRHISDLYKYKVVKIIGSGMLTLHSELQQLYFVKIVRKTVAFSKHDLILPESVPYMVKLYNYYNCENAVFLILHYYSTQNVWDYVRQNFSNKTFAQDELLEQNEATACDFSDNDSEFSYSDLINDYTSSKTAKTEDSSSPEITESPTDLSENIPKAKTTTTTEWDEFENFDGVVVVPRRFVVKWAAQLLLALEKLHSLGVICCDLNCGNLMVDDGGDLLLTYKCSIKEVNQVCVDLAPEVYTFQKLTKAVDWWSYGSILYELLVGMPLAKIHPEGLSNYTILKIPRYVSAEAKSLLKQLLAIDPNDRLGCGLNGVENLKSHPFFSAISWDSLLLKYKTHNV